MQISQKTLPIAHAMRFAYRTLPLRGMDRVFRAAFNPANQSDFQFEIPLFEGVFVGHANNWIDWYALFHGCYEPNEIQTMRKFLSKRVDPIVLDIGASVGHHSLALAGVATQVHAFEPYPPRLAALRANVARNPHLEITVHPIALGLEDGEVSFRLPTTGEWAGVQFDPNGSLRFPIRNADNYLLSNEIKRVDLIKIDVDGNECDILQSLQCCLRSCQPAVMIEANNGVESFRDLLPGYQFSSNGPGNVFCTRGHQP